MTYKNRPSKEELQTKYNELGSTEKLGEFYRVSQVTALKWLNKNEIKINKSNLQISKEKKPSKEELEAKCKELGYNTRKVGELYAVTHGTALNWMVNYEIKANKSNVQISQEKKPSKEELEAKCKELGYNAAKVGKYYEVNNSTAWDWMKECKIKTGRSNPLEKAVEEYVGKQNDIQK